MLGAWFIAAYVLYMGLNVGIAIIHREASDTWLINRFMWASIYIASLVILFFVLNYLRFETTNSLYLIAAIILQYTWFFAPMFNVLTGSPPFNLSKTTGIYNRALRKLGFKSTEKIFLLTLLVSMVLLTKSIIGG